ncbi:MAG: hypothetical protein AAF726_09370 [Planctomycetota bacterium]
MLSRFCFASLISSAWLAGCSAECSEDSPPCAENVHSAAESGVSPLDFVLERHDVNGDGRVLASEYSRSRQSFARLDRTGDGVLDAADFDGDVERGEKRQRRAAVRAQRLIARHFQADADPAILLAEELSAAFALYDANSDGEIYEEEFRCGAQLSSDEERGEPLETSVQRKDPWPALIATLDGDRDGALSEPELLSFYRARNPNGVWMLLGDSVVSVSEGGAELRPLQGKLAPDFCLRPPDGGPPECLSDLCESKPVALIFGSYT